MRGQTSAEMLLLIGAILIVVASMFYSGAASNESAVVMQAARDGAEKALAALDAEYGCSAAIKEVGFDRGTITITVYVRGFQQVSDFDNLVKENVRNGALAYIRNAVGGSFLEAAGPVRTSYYTYDVMVEVERVVR